MESEQWSTSCWINFLIRFADDPLFAMLQLAVDKVHLRAAHFFSVTFPAHPHVLLECWVCVRYWIRLNVGRVAYWLCARSTVLRLQTTQCCLRQDPDYFITIWQFADLHFNNGFTPFIFVFTIVYFDNVLYAEDNIPNTERGYRLDPVLKYKKEHLNFVSKSWDLCKRKNF